MTTATSLDVGGVGKWAQRWQRFRARGLRQQVRTIFLRVWPLSLLTTLFYRLRYWEPVWYYVLNRKARGHLLRARPAADAELTAVSNRLRNDGICVLELDELVGADHSFQRVLPVANALLESDEMRQQVAARHSAFGDKHYVMRIRPRLDLEDPLTSITVDDRLLAVVNSYLGLSARLKSFELWNNLPVDPATPEVASMRWHRDYDDHKIVKVFLYLVDVDAEMGAFTFMRETQPGGRFGTLYPSRPPTGSYPAAGAVESALPSEQRICCAAGAGTLVICDATGFHKGGRSVTRPRAIFTITYASDAAIDPDVYTLAETNDYSDLSPAARFALRLD